MRHEEAWAATRGPVQAVYWAGAPTEWSAKAFSEILSTLRCVLPLAYDVEITVEGRLWGLSDEKVATSVESGANCVSPGVRTFQTEFGHKLGRRLDGGQVIEP